MRQHDHCLVCGSSEYRTMSQEYAHAWLVKCNTCGFVYCCRIPTEEELGQHYAKYPRNVAVSPITIKRYEELLEEFEPYRRTNRILDIGCGDGHFLTVAKSKGWNVFGTEFTDEAVEVCRTKGIEMHKGIIQSWQGEGNFDVITSFEVLEHIMDGREHAATVNSLLGKGGLFYFTTPNFDSLSRRWLGGKWKMIEYPEHLCYYTAKTITHLLTGAGLRKVDILTTGISLRKTENETAGNAHQQVRKDSFREEELRTSLESKPHLRFAKRITNWWLNALRLGDTLKGYFVKG